MQSRRYARLRRAEFDHIREEHARGVRTAALTCACGWRKRHLPSNPVNTGDPMKQLTVLAVMVMVGAACNLSSKLKSGNNSNSSSSSSDGSGKLGDEPVEKPNPTAAQTAALANGQEGKWDQQGITWTLPGNQM